MMYYEQDGKKYGVLNDFDLAAIMAVGERTPKKQGFERTGTLPFMALDLNQSNHWHFQVRRVECALGC